MYLDCEWLLHVQGWVAKYMTCTYLKHPTHTEITYFDTTFTTQEKILRFDVPMDDIL